VNAAQGRLSRVMHKARRPEHKLRTKVNNSFFIVIVIIRERLQNLLIIIKIDSS
jgi:hypothetical protein